MPHQEVYAHLLGEFDLVNVSIEFGHPFQAALERPEMQELQQQLRASGLWRRVAEASSSLTHARETTGPTTASSLRAHGAVSWTRRKLEASGVKSPGLGLQRWRESLATYKLRSRERRGWDFALVHVTGHDGISVSDVTLALDQSLGTKGNCLGVADPLASKYVVGTTLSALDLAFPTAVKCGGVCADLLPSRKRLCVAAYERARLAGAGAAPSGVDEPEMGGVAGILLPADVSIHSVVSTGSSRVGPELRVTSAQGQVIKQMQFDDDKEKHREPLRAAGVMFCLGEFVDEIY
eukprot:g3778.t1